MLFPSCLFVELFLFVLLLSSQWYQCLYNAMVVLAVNVGSTMVLSFMFDASISFIKDFIIAFTECACLTHYM